MVGILSEEGATVILSDHDGAFSERRDEVSSEGLEGDTGDSVLLGWVRVLVGVEEEAMLVVAFLVRWRWMVWLDMV